MATPPSTSNIDRKQSPRVHYPVSTVYVEPTVFFEILDHHTRRPEKERRVIGALYGILRTDILEIFRTLPLLHTEQEGTTLTLHLQYWDELQRLEEKSDLPPLVGWYATGTTSSDKVIDQTLSTRGTMYACILLDGSLSREKLRPRVLVAGNTESDHEAARFYKDIAYEIRPCSNAQKLLLRHVYQTLFPESATLSNTKENQVFKNFLEDLDNLSPRIRGLARISKNPETAAEVPAGLRNLLVKLPTFPEKRFQELFTSSMRDVATIKYAIKALKTLLVLIEKRLDA